jgi:hypothetical protein
MSDKDKADIRKSDAEADVGYINAGMITPEEARNRLQNDETSLYHGVDLSGPAPEMPDYEDGGEPRVPGAQGLLTGAEDEQRRPFAADEAFDCRTGPRIIVGDAAWNENDHPRDRDGRFGSGGGGGGSGEADPFSTRIQASGWQDAVAKLTEAHAGYVSGALSHPDVGEIDIPWGKEGTGHHDGFGLSKLVKFHPEVVENLPEIIGKMKVVSRSKNRVKLESDDHEASVRLTWNGEDRKWLLTAYQKNSSADIGGRP